MQSAGGLHLPAIGKCAANARSPIHQLPHPCPAATEPALGEVEAVGYADREHQFEPEPTTIQSRLAGRQKIAHRYAARDRNHWRDATRPGIPVTSKSQVAGSGTSEMSD